MEELFKKAESEEGTEAILVSVFPKGKDTASKEAGLDELERLLETAGGRTFAKIVQYRDHPENATYIGTGKIEELKALCNGNEISLVICDDELSPIQIRNLENLISDETEVRVIDRSMLILDIFALHAASADGKLQVELAQLQYSAPRLIGKGKSLSRLGGGIGTRGPGESKLELDRRHLKERISALEAQLEELQKNREIQRKKRKKSGLYQVAIAGYTNAGKSTLLNALTGAGVKEKDELFATLDPTTRKFALPSGREILLTDTVGFIRNLPHHLIKAFRSTLDEVALCDGILVIVDSSDPESSAQLQVTRKLLEDLGASDKRTYYVLNKSDKANAIVLPPPEKDMLGNVLTLSAKTGEGIDRLIEKLEEMANESSYRVEIRLPHQDSGLLNRLYSEATVLEVEYTDAETVVQAIVDEKTRGRFKKYITGYQEEQDEE